MATHSSVLAWRIPQTEEPGGLLAMGSQRVRHDWATKHSTAGGRRGRASRGPSSGSTHIALQGLGGSSSSDSPGKAPGWPLGAGPHQACAAWSGACPKCSGLNQTQEVQLGCGLFLTSRDCDCVGTRPLRTVGWEWRGDEWWHSEEVGGPRVSVEELHPLYCPGHPAAAVSGLVDGASVLKACNAIAAMVCRGWQWCFCPHFTGQPWADRNHDLLLTMQTQQQGGPHSHFGRGSDLCVFVN